MPAMQIRWSTLFNLADIDIKPEPPKVLKLSDEALMTISWLTGATGHDRRLLRCNDQGALLMGNAWDNLVEVETDELHPQSGTSDTFNASTDNEGVLVSTSTQLVKVTFVRVAGGSAEVIYVPAETLYFYPHKTYSIQCNVVPDPGGTASYVGITAFN